MFKKTAAVFAAIIIVLSSLCLTVSADDRGSVTLTQTSYAEKGGTFTVDVRLDSNPGIKSMSCNVRFDYQVLKVNSVSDSGLLGGFFYTSNSNIVQLTWTGNGKDVNSTGSLATITFTALEAPTEGSIAYASVSASDSRGIKVTVDGNTTILNFGLNQLPFLPEPLVTDAEVTEALPITEEEETEDFFDETTAPLETEPPTTTPEPTTTPAPTTTKKPVTTKKTETKKRETAAPTTTPEPTTELTTTTPEPTTTTEPTTAPITTTEATTTTDALMLGVTSAPDEGEEFAEEYTDDLDNKSANRGTILLALIALALTGVIVVAIELYRRRS